MEITNWIKEKIKDINSIVDLGIIISIISGLLIFSTYWYKITLLNIIGVPFSITVSIIHISTADILINSVVMLFLILLTIMIFYLIYIVSVKKKISNIIKLILGVLIILKLFRVSTYKIITVEISSILLTLGLLLAIHAIRKRPTNLIKKIFKYRKESEKLIVSIMETIFYLITFVCVYLLLANLYLSMPVNRQVIDKKIVLYSSDTHYLVSDYIIRDEHGVNKVKITGDSFELIPKEKDNIKLQTLYNTVFMK